MMPGDRTLTGSERVVQPARVTTASASAPMAAPPRREWERDFMGMLGLEASHWL